MRKVVSILISALFLAAGMQVTVDRHYCGGSLADVSVSVTGKLASCGMEKSVSDCPGKQVLDQKCCEDHISHYSVISSCSPVCFKIKQPVPERDLIPMIACNFISTFPVHSEIINGVLPPGEYITRQRTQSEIGVFRI